jgi:hypothetical protein
MGIPSRHLIWINFASLHWALWIIHNKALTEGIFIKTPSDSKQFLICHFGVRCRERAIVGPSATLDKPLPLGPWHLLLPPVG